MYHPRKTRLYGALLSCAALLLVLGTARAQTTYLLSDLIAGSSGTDGKGNVLVGDKLFNNWAYSTIGNDMPTAGNVSVQGQTVSGNFGLEFLGFWHANPGSGAELAFINYRVTVTDPNFRITDVHLDGDPTVNSGIGQASVTESVSDTVNHLSVLPRPLSIFSTATAVAGMTTRLNDSLNTNAGYLSLDIEKSITVSSDSPNTLAQITHIQQTFSQSPVAPEPGSGILLLPVVGLLMGSSLMARRRRALL